MIRSNVVAGLLCVAFGALVFWLSAGVPDFTATDDLGGRFLPRLLAYAMMAAGAALALTGWLGIEIQGGTVGKRGSTAAAAAQAESAGGSGAPVSDDEPRARGFPWLTPGEQRVLGFIAVMAFYTVILPLLGYLLSSLLCFAAMIAIAGERRPWRIGLGAVAIAGFLYVLFGFVFNVSLPTASLFGG